MKSGVVLQPAPHAKKVLIADYENWDSLMDIPRLFRRAGCSIDLYCREKSWLPKGNHHTTRIHASDDPGAYLAGICALADSYDWVVIGDDFTARLIARDADDRVFKKISPIKKTEQRFLLGSKAGLSKACTEYGIPTPQYSVLGEGGSSEFFWDSIDYPVVFKIDESAGGNGVFLCTDPDDARAKVNSLSIQDVKNLVIQKYIAGQNVSVESIYKEGILVAYAYSYVRKTLSGEFGVSCDRVYFNYPAIEPRLALIGASFGLNGFCSMTFMFDGTEHYLIEADVRPQAWYLLAAHSGVDFAQGIREFFSNSPVLVRSSARAEVVIRHFPRDLLRSFHEKEYAGIVKWLYGADGRWKTVPWKDPVLLSTVLFRGVRFILRRIFSERRV